MERLTVYSYNNQTRTIEEFIKSSSWRHSEHHPMQKVSTENVRVIVDAIMKHYGRDYEMHPIYIELLSDCGLSVTMKLDALDNWDGKKLSYDTKLNLHSNISYIADALGLPNSVIYSNGHYYAQWIRNMVLWF